MWSYVERDLLTRLYCSGLWLFVWLLRCRRRPVDFSRVLSSFVWWEISVEGFQRGLCCMDGWDAGCGHSDLRCCICSWSLTGNSFLPTFFIYGHTRFSTSNRNQLYKYICLFSPPSQDFLSTWPGSEAPLSRDYCSFFFYSTPSRYSGILKGLYITFFYWLIDIRR